MRDLSLIPSWGLAVWSLYVPYVGTSHCPDMHVRVTADYESAYSCLSLYVSSVMNRRPMWDVLCLSANDSWDRLLRPATLQRISTDG